MTINQVILLCCLLISPLAWAQKVVVFSPETAIFSTQAAQRLSTEISQQLATQLQMMQSLGSEIEQLQQRFSQDQDLMSTEELQSLEENIRQQTQEFRRLQQYVNAVKEQNEQAFLQSIRPQLDAAMQQYIETHQVDLVINANAAVYVGDGIDITAAITALLDQE